MEIQRRPGVRSARSGSPIPDRDRRFRPRGKIGHDRPESPVTLLRNPRSRSIGNRGHVGPEYAAIPSRQTRRGCLQIVLVFAAKTGHATRASTYYRHGIVAGRNGSCGDCVVAWARIGGDDANLSRCGPHYERASIGQDRSTRGKARSLSAYRPAIGLPQGTVGGKSYAEYQRRLADAKRRHTRHSPCGGASDRSSVGRWPLRR